MVAGIPLTVTEYIPDSSEAVPVTVIVGVLTVELLVGEVMVIVGGVVSCGMAVKVALTVIGVVGVKLQPPPPVQPPDQLVKVKSGCGTAIRVTGMFFPK